VTQVRVLVPDAAAAFQALRLTAQPDRACFGAFDGSAIVGVLGLLRVLPS
jgi:hypothetical protein